MVTDILQNILFCVLQKKKMARKKVI